MQIKIEDLIPNEQWQTRHQLDKDNVERLAQAMRDKKQLPDILVRARDDGKYEIFDGFHRFAAAKWIERQALEAEVWEGDEHSALAEGVTRNMQHGLQLIKKDMQRAAKMLYKPGSMSGSSGTGMRTGSAAWVGVQLGISGPTIDGWLNPKRQRKYAEGKRKERSLGRTAQKQGKKAAAKRIEEEAMERFGAEAFSRQYEGHVKWSLKHKAGSPGTPVLMVSDIHYGEKVEAEQVYNSNEFNIEICKRRLRKVFETATGLLKTHFAHPHYEGIVLVLGGDLISGSIHDDLSETDEVTPLVQCYDIAKEIADGIAFLADEFPRVSVYCVGGNHGRTTRKPRAKFYAQHNLDWLAYKMIGDYVKTLENVEVWAPNARDLNFEVAGHRYRLTHGDQFRGGDGIIGPIGPITRGDVRKRVTASLMPGQPEAYDTMLCGHFHTLMMLPRLIVNGSIKGYDEYALSINVAWEPPQQALWTVHPKHGHTWYMPVLCT